jgi:hypothetical protein
MIWEDCKGVQQIRSASGTAYRLVESQEQIATLGYVDTLAEQALLEEMLESTKPAYPFTTDGFHYLLKTPFRYPPLKWGSRFGRIHEPGIFYGGSNKQTTLAESAYYRLVFWYSIDAKPIKNKIRSEHTLFSVDYLSTQAIQLQSPPFNQYIKTLTHLQDYALTQQLGTAMRAECVEVFEYISARDPQRGICVGLFTPTAFIQKAPTEMTAWLCEVSANEVAFKQRDKAEVIRFSIEDFMVNGELPLPAG